MATKPTVLKVQDLSDYLRIHRSTVYRLLRKGQLPAFKVGSDWRFNVETIDAWRFGQNGELPKDDIEGDSDKPSARAAHMRS
jgi:excisionase family DNA binding protein